MRKKQTYLLIAVVLFLTFIFTVATNQRELEKRENLISLSNIPFSERVLKTNNGKKSKKSWTELKQRGSKFITSRQHKLMYKHQEAYKKCFDFTTSMQSQYTFFSSKVESLANSSFKQSSAELTNLYKVASATFSIYIKDYHKEEYPLIFKNFFLNYSFFEGLCYDKIFAKNIDKLIIDFNKVIVSEKN
ncbi:MAG TPA: hypothetical protein DCL21_06560 [Alphaproteobacteria bacterium]|nr:hypothetical protein [Alphaproteobacteria bacterium]